MIDLVRRRLLNVRHNYVNPTLRQRAQGLVVMTWAAIFFILLLMATRAVLSILNIDRSTIILPPEYVVAIFALFAVNALIQRGRLDAAVWLFLGLMLVPFVLATLLTVDPEAPVVLILPLVAAGLLINRRSLIPILVILALTLLLRSINEGGTTNPVPYIPANNAISDLINYGLVFGLSAVFLLVFNGSIEQTIASSFVDIEQLKAVSKFNLTLGDQTDETRILAHILEVVERDMGFDLAQIYLSDSEGRFTRRLRLGLSQLESATHVALRPGDESVMLEAIASKTPVMVVTHDPLPPGEHLAAPARQSATLALVYRDQVYAILDVQSEHPQMFSENTLAGLKDLTTQAARELAQAHRIEELERSVRDQEAIINRFLTQMSELQQRSQSMAGQGWSNYLGGRGGFGFDYDRGNILASRDLPAPIRSTIRRGEIYIEPAGENGQQRVNVPITLRDQILGAISFTVPADRPLNERHVEMLRTVSNRLGIALESNRLLEQTQAQAQRERKASEIGSVLLSATDIEAVLGLAAQNFNEALGAVHTRVYLEPGALVGEAEAGTKP